MQNGHVNGHSRLPSPTISEQAEALELRWATDPRYNGIRRDYTAKDVIARVGHCMPSDVWLSGLTVENMKQMKLSGSSFLEAGVFDFVRWLEQAPGFEDVALRSTRPSQSSSGPAIDFNVELNLGDIDGSVREVARND